MRQIIVFHTYIFVFLLVAGAFSSCSRRTGTVDPDVNSKDQEILREKIEIDHLNALSDSVKYFSFQLSYSYASKALEMAKKINYTKGIAEAYYRIELYFHLNRNYVSSMKYALLTYDFAKKTRDYKMQAKLLNQIGAIYYSIKWGDRSSKYYNLALATAQKIHDTDQIINIFINLSLAYSDSNNYQAAKKYLFYSLFLSLKQHNQQQEEGLFRHIGILYSRQNKFTEALYYFEKSIRLNIRTGMLFNIGSLYTMIAHIFELREDYSSALNYNKLALTYRLLNNHDEQIASSYINIGVTYLKMGQLDNALNYINKGIAEASLFNPRKNNLLETGYENLYKLYKMKNNSALALENYKKFTIYRDSVREGTDKQLISILETNHFIKEKEQETADLKGENFIQKLEMKNRGLLELLLMALFLLTSTFVVYIQQLLVKSRKAKKVAEDKNDQLQDEIKEQTIQNEELTKREEEYRFLAYHTADLVTLMDSNFKCLFISPSSELLLGYLPDELLNMMDYRDLIHPDSRKSFDVEFESMLEYHAATRFLYQVIQKDGTILWVESNINPIFNPSTGKLQAILSITRDVSSQIEEEQALMESAKQKDMLIREVHHRVKNNLAILTSLVNMQKSEFTDHKTLDVFSDLQFRVRAMALVHEELYKSRNIEFMSVGEYLSKLVGIVSSAFTTSKVKVHQDFQDEILNVKITLPLGLIVNELMTNAFKYAFPDHGEGNIWVTFKKEPNSNNSKIESRRLTVRDDGQGLPNDFDFSKQSSMGSQIISLLVRQLEAKLIIDGTNGASFSIILPSGS
jgi:PAS domain S-box-containing protein